jgi:uncharacterized PurR-regulated membrane protein YhhQ (DUF165 family)
VTLILTTLLCFALLAFAAVERTRLTTACAVLMFSIPSGIGIGLPYPFVGLSTLSNILYVGVLTGILIGRAKWGSHWVWVTIWATLCAALFGLLFRLLCANPIPPSDAPHVDAMRIVSDVGLQVSGASFVAFGVVAMTVAFLPRVTVRNYLAIVVALQIIDSLAFFPLAFWGKEGTLAIAAVGAIAKIEVHLLAWPLFYFLTRKNHGL